MMLSRAPASSICKQPRVQHCLLDARAEDHRSALAARRPASAVLGQTRDRVTASMSRSGRLRA
eukprot:637066-Lingulodinium_polyedra.AAC.1